ncbi:DUF3823 domain-containing protein [Sinomicrobium weinanense]|uniref:DUF3823 domain-containing protein n=1 Tax=Sinomicrobium weinanense TaxID=2842200 RepID=A0A926JTJ3_9FLAO|nr:DUF3823 domain-containing protein [Sinomicrobium weinanense]MBC9797104.1 DUF3823 domain-containing protein [Sinomicrobium weinanense]MBU3124800.1 DUF3823 domain-containing protein [Sinomicrobium weinanense]
MKTLKINSIAYLVVLCLASCGIDNFDDPETYFSGRVVYEGEPLQVRHGEVGFQLWQPGYGDPGAIGVPVNQDGSFSARLFDGVYKLVFTDNAGPFRTEIISEEQLDTIFFTLEGDMTMDVEVTPYYTVRDAQFSLSGNTVQASCSVEQVITGEEAKNVERVTLYLNGTNFVSDNDQENYAGANAEINDLGAVNVSAEIPEDNVRNYVFARIGVKISGVEDMIFSPVEKLEF